MDFEAGNGIDWVKSYLETRVERGRTWRKFEADHAKLAKAATPSYIRIQGDGFRPVSISDTNPCGCLLEASGENVRKIKKSRRLDEPLIQRVLAARTEKPGAEKPEHQLQAYLIRSALQNKDFGRLDVAKLDLSKEFDELIFITDELNVPSGEVPCRLDIVALGLKDDVYFPVFIELKNGRHFDRLVIQLDNACKKLWQSDDERIRPIFAEFLSAASNIPLSKITLKPDAARKMIIWTKSPSGKADPKVRKACEDGLLIVEFELAYNFSRIKS